jgi:hypothetical protein
MSNERPVAIPPDCPEQLLDALRARGADIEGFRPHPPRVRVWASSPNEKLFAWYSTDPADQAVVENEVAVRAAIGTDGPLRAPPVLAYGPLWRLEPALEPQRESGPGRRALPHPLAGEGIDDVVAAIRVLQRSELGQPPPQLARRREALESRRESRPGLRALPPLAGEWIDSVVAAIRVLQGSELPQPPPQLGGSREAPIARWRRRRRMLQSPLPTRDLVRARRLFSQSPLPLTTSHGDLHRKQIFPAPGGIWVVDWELLGKRPAGWDALYLLWDLEDPDDRERLFLATLELVGPRYRSDLLTLNYAALVKMIVGKLVGSRRADDHEHGRMLLDELPRVRKEAGIS